MRFEIKTEHIERDDVIGVLHITPEEHKAFMDIVQESYKKEGAVEPPASSLKITQILIFVKDGDDLHGTDLRVVVDSTEGGLNA